MQRTIRTVTQWIGAILAVIIVALAAFQIAGPARVWQLFGPEDLGTVDFATLQRRETPNDALACPADLCNASADFESPSFDVPASELRTMFRAAISSEPQVELVEADDTNLTDRYIQRSRFFGFPDTIVVTFLERPDNRSTLALYSRSRFGRSDFGVNKARLERWLSELKDRIKPMVP